MKKKYIKFSFIIKDLNEWPWTYSFVSVFSKAQLELFFLYLVQPPG